MVAWYSWKEDIFWFIQQKNEHLTTMYNMISTRWCTHAKLAPLTSHPLAWDRHNGPASGRFLHGTWFSNSFFCNSNTTPLLRTISFPVGKKHTTYRMSLFVLVLNDAKNVPLSENIIVVCVSFCGVKKIDPFFDIFKISIRIEKFWRKVGNTLYKFLDILKGNFVTFLRQFLEKLAKNYPKSMKLFWEYFEIIWRNYKIIILGTFWKFLGKYIR